MEKDSRNNGISGGDRVNQEMQAPMARNFIEGNGIKAASIRTSPEIEKVALEAHHNLGISGGIRVPHLHLNDEIYLLTNEQWGKYSAGILTDAKAVLANVKEIGFEEAIMLERATQAIAKK